MTQKPLDPPCACGSRNHSRCSVSGPDYAFALTERITRDVRDYVRPHQLQAVKDIVEKHTIGILTEIQHRLYQDVLANGLDLARHIYPKGERP